MSSMFSKCWLFLQFSALSTVSGCLPFTINTCHLTILTKAISKQQVRMMRVVWFFFFNYFGLICSLETCPSSHPCPSLLHSLTLYHPTFLSFIYSVILSVFTSFPSPFLPCLISRTDDFQYVTLLNKVLNILQVS